MFLAVCDLPGQQGPPLIFESVDANLLIPAKSMRFFLDAQNDIGQIWFRGNDNADGCFTLQHRDDSGLFLTAIDSNRLELHGNFLF